MSQQMMEEEFTDQELMDEIKRQSNKRKSDDESTQEDETLGKKQPPKKRQKLIQTIDEGYIIHLKGVPKTVPQEIEVNFADKGTLEDYPDACCTIIDRDRILLKLSESEKKEIRRKYRQEYNTKNIDKPKKIETEEEIALRKLANQDPEVIKRKSQRAIGRRTLLKKYREKDPELYNLFMEENFPKKPRKKNVPKKDE